MSWSIPPQLLFISAFYPSLLPALWLLLTSLPSTLFSSLHSLPGLVCYIAYVYFKNAWQAFCVNVSPTAVILDRYLYQFSLSHFSFLPPQLVRELLHEGQAISVGVSAESGRGGQWLARIRQLIKEGSVPDVSLVPVGISYDCLPKTNKQVDVCKHSLAIFNVHRSKWTGLVQSTGSQTLRCASTGGCGGRDNSTSRGERERCMPVF